MANRQKGFWLYGQNEILVNLDWDEAEGHREWSITLAHCETGFFAVLTGSILRIGDVATDPQIEFALNVRKHFQEAIFALESVFDLRELYEYVSAREGDGWAKSLIRSEFHHFLMVATNQELENYCSIVQSGYKQLSLLSKTAYSEGMLYGKENPCAFVSGWARIIYSRYEATQRAMQERNERPGYCYLIEAITQQGEKLYKIGRTKNPEDRMATFQNKLPYAHIEYVAKIQVPDCYYAEAILHRLYSDCRVRGEWFRLDESRISAIEKLWNRFPYHRRQKYYIWEKDDLMLHTRRIATECK